MNDILLQVLAQGFRICYNICIPRKGGRCYEQSMDEIWQYVCCTGYGSHYIYNEFYLCIFNASAKIAGKCKEAAEVLMFHCVTDKIVEQWIISDIVQVDKKRYIDIE